MQDVSQVLMRLGDLAERLGKHKEDLTKKLNNISDSEIRETAPETSPPRQDLRRCEKDSIFAVSFKQPFNELNKLFE